jgi:serine/threonine protein kinase
MVRNAQSLPDHDLQHNAALMHKIAQNGFSQDDSIRHAHLYKTFPVGEGYLLLKEIGKGSYGHVVLARHIGTGRNVAIKKVSNVFKNDQDAKRLLREIQILRQMERHRNVIKLYDVIEPTKSPETFEDLYYVFEAERADLLSMMD